MKEERSKKGSREEQTERHIGNLSLWKGREIGKEEGREGRDEGGQVDGQAGEKYITLLI